MITYKTPVPSTLQEAILHKIESCIYMAEIKLGITQPMPSVNFDLKGTTGGTANVFTNTISVNRILFLENVNEYIEKIIPHEVSHLVAFKKFGMNIRAHGKEFKYVMRMLGVTPFRCHTLNAQNARVRKVKRYAYECVHCQTNLLLTSHQHNKQLANRNAFKHTKCGMIGNLIFKNQIEML